MSEFTYPIKLIIDHGEPNDDLEMVRYIKEEDKAQAISDVQLAMKEALKPYTDPNTPV